MIIAVRIARVGSRGRERTAPCPACVLPPHPAPLPLSVRFRDDLSELAAADDPA